MSEEIIERQKRISIPLTIILDSGSANREARVSDLSMGGCYVDSISAVRLQEVIKFQLALPGGKTEELSGTVVYVHQGIGFGLQFKDLTPEQQTVIEQVILLNGGTV